MLASTILRRFQKRLRESAKGRPCLLRRSRPRSFSDCLFFDSLLYLCHVRAFSGPLVKEEVLVDSDEPEALTSRSLEVQVRARYVELPDETGLSDIPIEKPDVEVFSQANEVPFWVRLHDLATEDITIERTDAVP